MTKKKTDSEIVIDCLHEMYMRSDPPFDFKSFSAELKEGKKKCPKTWYREHKINEKVYEHIKAKYMKRFKEKFKQRAFEWDLFNYGPTIAQGEE